MIAAALSLALILVLFSVLALAVLAGYGPSEPPGPARESGSTDPSTSDARWRSADLYPDLRQVDLREPGT